MNNLNRINNRQYIASIQSPPRAHNCPNCQCSSKPVHIVNEPQIFYYPPVSPTCFNKRIISIPEVQPQRTGHTRAMMSPQNIYFKRTDRQNSNNSFKSDRSVNSVSSSKLHFKVNIRYSSPKKSNIQQNLNVFNVKKQQKYKIQPNIYVNYNRKQIQNKSQIEQDSLIIDDQPVTPAVLLKKSRSSTKNDFIINNSPKEFTQSDKKQKRQEKRESQFSSVSGIFNKNNKIQVVSKGQWGTPSAYDVLVQEDQDKLIAGEISKQLKLNYDYMDTEQSSGKQN